jgi:hypothetical protein
LLERSIALAGLAPVAAPDAETSTIAAAIIPAKLTIRILVTLLLSPGGSRPWWRAPQVPKATLRESDIFF